MKVYIDPFWCGFVVGAVAVFVVLLMYGIYSKSINKRK